MGTACVFAPQTLVGGHCSDEVSLEAVESLRKSISVIPLEVRVFTSKVSSPSEYEIWSP